jgi:hypothetical protein
MEGLDLVTSVHLRWPCNLVSVGPKGRRAESGSVQPRNRLAEVEVVSLGFPPGGSRHFEKASLSFVSVSDECWEPNPEACTF